MSSSVRISILVTMLALAACGSNGGNTIDGAGGGGDGNGNGDGGTGDGGTTIDGVVPPGCVPGATQCSDCMDNDADGDIDGFDIECTGAADNDEGSFETAIPGDNMDDKWQDCFFDGNSGAGDDGCRFHTCCLLGIMSPAVCPVDANFDSTSDCPMQTQMCIDTCAPLTPPGCDCFGCCTLCDDAGCVDIFTNPAVAPNCDQSVIHDPNLCPPCVKNTECGTPCNPEMCILCPGQDPSDLPPSCTGAECPGGAQECSTMPCPDGLFCSNGCCISVIE